MDPFLAQITMFGGNFAPRGWAYCDGQLIAISQNSALFSLLGTTYGGDGRTTFALPDLRGRVPIHAGTGPGLSTYRLGARGGTETVTLNTLQIPSHSHAASFTPTGGGGGGAATATVKAVTGANNQTDDPTGNFWAQSPTAGAGQADAYADGTSGTEVEMAAGAVTVTGGGGGITGGSVAIGNTGGSQWHTNVQPFLVIHYIIALVGTYPSRN